MPVDWHNQLSKLTSEYNRNHVDICCLTETKVSVEIDRNSKRLFCELLQNNERPRSQKDQQLVDLCQFTEARSISKAIFRAIRRMLGYTLRVSDDTSSK